MGENVIKNFVGYDEKGNKKCIDFEEKHNNNVLIAGPIAHGKIILLETLLSTMIANMHNKPSYTVKVLCIGGCDREFYPFEKYVDVEYVKLETPYYYNSLNSYFANLQESVKERKSLLKKYNCESVSDLPVEVAVNPIIIFVTDFHLLKEQYYYELLQDGDLLGFHFIATVNFLNDISSLSGFSRVILVGYKGINYDLILKNCMPFLENLSVDELAVLPELGEAMIYDKNQEGIFKVSIPFFSRQALVDILDKGDASYNMQKMLDAEGEKLRTQHFLESLSGEERVGLLFGAFMYIKNNEQVYLIVNKGEEKIVKDNLNFLFPFGINNIVLEEDKTEKARIVVGSGKDKKFLQEYEIVSLDEFIKNGKEYYNTYARTCCNHFAKLLSGNVNVLRMQYSKWRKNFQEFLCLQEQPISFKCLSFYDYLARLNHVNPKDELEIKREFRNYVQAEGIDFGKKLQEIYPVLRETYSLEIELAKENLMNFFDEYTEDEAYSVVFSLIAIATNPFFQLTEHDVGIHIAKLDLFQFLMPLIIKYNLTEKDISSLIFHLPHIILYGTHPEDIKLLLLNHEIVGCTLKDNNTSCTFWSDAEELDLFSKTDFEKATEENYPLLDIESKSMQEIMQLHWIDYYM